MATATVERTAPPDTTPGPIMSHRQIMFVMYGLMAGMFLSALDQTIVGTAIRTIGDDLNGLDQQAWVTTAYLIAATVTTPLYGKLSDLFGRRPLFIISIADPWIGESAVIECTKAMSSTHWATFGKSSLTCFPHWP